MSKNLVIVLSETREYELTFDNFKKNVIDILNADLCLCIGVKNDYNYDNPFYKLSKYNFLYDEENDKNFGKSVEYSYNETNKNINLEKYEKFENINCIYSKISDKYHCDDKIKYIGDYNNIDEFNINELEENDIYVYHKEELNNSFNKSLYSIKSNKDDTYVPEENVISYVKKKHYMDFLKIKDKIQFENNDPNCFSNFTISTYIHIFFLWFLQQNIIKHDLINKYDRFIILRSDYIYELPIPKLNLLDEKYIWIPDGEHYYGLCDRFVILSKFNILSYINILECFYKRSNKYYNNIKNGDWWNMEKILKMHLIENNVINLVKYIPYVMYCIRSINGKTRFQVGDFNDEKGYFIKYKDEYNNSLYYKDQYNNYELNIDDFYKNKLLEINN